MAVLTKAEFLGLRCEKELVELPGGGQLWIAVFSANERENFEGWLTKANERKNWIGLYAKFASLVIVDESGQRMFSDDELQPLGKLPAPVLRRIWQEGHRINAMTPEAEEDIEKNSESGPTSSSP